jgi:hypothetical protein
VCRVVKEEEGMHPRVWPGALYTCRGGTNKLRLSCYLKGTAVDTYVHMGVPVL